MAKRWYKVVRGENGNYRSAIVAGDLARTYKIGQVTQGYKRTPVLVFSSLVNARGFAACRDVILVGEAGSPHPQPRICELGVASATTLSFWRKGSAYSGTTWLAPDGTYAADWFKPTKVVSRKQ